jgi:hypothetical protein
MGNVDAVAPSTDILKIVLDLKGKSEYLRRFFRITNALTHGHSA